MTQAITITRYTIQQDGKRRTAYQISTRGTARTCWSTRSAADYLRRLIR